MLMWFIGKKDTSLLLVGALSDAIRKQADFYLQRSPPRKWQCYTVKVPSRVYKVSEASQFADLAARSADKETPSIESLEDPLIFQNSLKRSHHNIPLKKPNESFLKVTVSSLVDGFSLKKEGSIFLLPV